MLSRRILRGKNIKYASDYYEDAGDDYYAKDDDCSAWQGKGSAFLGLKGKVKSEIFKELLIGKIGNKLQKSRKFTRKDSQNRHGIDLTFSAPKSISLQALIYGDRKVLEAHDQAVTHALLGAEKRAQARYKIKGREILETTGNLIIAKFRHETSRECDPQLHTHAVLMNLTQRSDGLWRTLKNDQIIKMTKYLGAVYRAELAYRLQKMGYQIRLERKGLFELSHISRDQIAEFSRRSAYIEKNLAKKGLTRETALTSEKYKATFQNRPQKVRGDREKIYQEWKKRAKNVGIQFDSYKVREKKYEYGPFLLPLQKAARQAVQYAINHLTERQSIINERELIETAVKHGMGAARLQEIEGEITERIEKGVLIREAPHYTLGEEQMKNAPSLTRDVWIETLMKKGLHQKNARERVDAAVESGKLVLVESRYTTKIALEREKNILYIERNGRSQMSSVMKPDTVREILVKSLLNEGQCHAIELMLTSCNRVIGIQGLAGTGKSHMLHTAKKLIEEQGYHVRVLAPYRSQVKALQEITLEAQTVASFLRASKQDINAQTVVVIDEAAVVPSCIMEDILKVIEQAGARVVLMGDTLQTKAIEAGRPFDLLQEAGMETASLTTIQRQKNPELKKAVELAAQGVLENSLQHIKNVIEIKEHPRRCKAIAESYVKLTVEDREKTLIVCGTNEARRTINAFVRKNLGTEGKGTECDILIRRDTTYEERSFSKNYTPGEMIQAERDHKNGLKGGEVYRVVATGPGNLLTVRHIKCGGPSISFNPRVCNKLSIYELEGAEFSPGDRVRITKSDKNLGLVNGDRFEICAINKERILLENDRRTIELSTEKPLHLDYSYATTVHGSQGLTSDRVLIDACTENRTLARDVYYVAISRARYEAKIYTNDMKKLPAVLDRENIKYAALDLIREKDVNHSLQGRAIQKDKDSDKGLERSFLA